MDSDESHVKIAYESQDGESQERSQDGEFPSVSFIEKEEVQCDVEPVRLVSIRPLVDTNDHSDSINSVVEQPSRQTARDLSKYNWKHFLPITRRDPSKPAIDEAGFLSLMFMSWATPAITKSFKRTLQLDDFDKLSPYESAEVNFSRGTRLWNEQVSKLGLHQANMSMVLWRAIRTRIFFAILFFILSQLISFLGPAIFVRRILEYVEEKDSLSQIEGIGWVIGLFLAEVTRSLLLCLSFFTNIRTAARARAMVLTMVYSKVTTLRNVGDKSIGEFVNLCASDAERVSQGVIFSSFVLAFPVIIVCTTIYTILYIGPSALIGCGLFALFFPVQAIIGRVAGRFRSKVVAISDRRVRMMSEILNCIKLIKMYAWEKPFAKAVIAIRRAERKALVKGSFLQGLNMAVALIIPTMATVGTFCVHVAAGKDLSTSQAYTVTTIFSVIIFSLAVLPFGIRGIAEARIALKRVQSLMVMEELEPFVEKPSDPLVSVSISEATFAWDKVKPRAENKGKGGFGARNGSKQDDVTSADTQLIEAKHTARKRKENGQKDGAGQGRRGPTLLEVKTMLEPALFDVDLTVHKKTLVGICGSVGSGKSSLLQALLGQMRVQKGNVMLGGTTAYAAQQAWIMNATVRDNILLGKPYHEARYNAACFACSLEQDLKILPSGDQTEIGERGINLSGGQKQRISLARALYADKDIYLLDDPLSAVDAHVGLHIFKHCIKGSLRNKTVLFATHQLQYLSQCDIVLYMKNGKIAERGTYEELIRNNGEFATLIGMFIREVEEELFDEDIGEFLHCGDRQRGDVALSSLSADDITKLFERQISASSRGRGLRSSSSEGNLEPFKLNDRVSSRRLRASSKQRRLSGGIESKARKEEEEKKKKEAGRLTQAEDRAEGAVTFQTYKTYMKSGGGYCVYLFLILFTALCLCGMTFIDTWLGIWLNAAASQNLTTPERSGIMANNSSNSFYIFIYVVSSLAFFIAVLMKTYFFVHLTLKSSSQLHDKVFERVSRASMAFFDTTPTGRILNRFSKDLDEIDIQLPFNLEASAQNVIRILISVAVIAVVFPWFLIGLFPLFILFLLITRIFNRSVRQLKRMDGVTRSPLYSHLSATVQGLSTLHAYNKMADFNEVFKKYLDLNTRPFFMFYCSNRWLAVRLDMLTVCIVTLAAFMVVLIKGTLPPAFLGLVLTYSLKLAHAGETRSRLRWTISLNSLFFVTPGLQLVALFTEMQERSIVINAQWMTMLLQFTVRQVAETEARFTSVERISYYIQSVPSEAALEIPEKKPPSNWPSTGAIQLSGIKMRYRDGLPLVLHNVSCEIKGCEKIGIVGRTGSGKSSLGVLLWRLVEPEAGSMHIDNVDITQIGLEDLRSRISIIPQDPVLFVGTVRYNLDPFKQHSDKELWKALEKAHLREMVDSLPAQLLAPVTENGENFSVGERQLICMARALLRHSKILLLDEATAAIDSETDAKIQDTIRESFKDCTLLTIAHRLNTVMDSDRIIVMDEGKIVEFDSPSTLLATPDSTFSKLVQATEIEAEDHYLVE